MDIGDSAIWGEHVVPEEGLRLTVGPLTLWCRRTAKELRLAHNVSLEEEPAAVTEMELLQQRLPDEEPEDPDKWSRWVFETPDPKIRLRPRLPEHPVVVKPGDPFHLLAGTGTRIFLRVPVRVEVEMLPRGGVITTIPTAVLSRTWFGTNLSGELCYFNPTAASRALETDLVRPYLAVCPLSIRNDSDRVLAVEKICLRVPHLSLFLQGDTIWSDTVEVSYRGTGDLSRLSYTGVAPKEAPGAPLVTPAAEPPRKGLAAWTFGTLKGAVEGMI